MGTSNWGRDFRAREKVLQHINYDRVTMYWKLVTSDLPVFDPIYKKFLFQNVIKPRTKITNVTEYENDASVLEISKSCSRDTPSGII